MARQKHMHFVLNEEVVPPSKLPAGNYLITMSTVEVDDSLTDLGEDGPNEFDGNVTVTHYLSPRAGEVGN